MLCVCLIFIALALRGEPSWWTAGFFAVCAVLFAAQIAPGASYLETTTKGFIVCRFFRKQPLIPWSDVSNFRVVSVPLRGKRIVYDCTDPKRGGHALPDTYGEDPESLVEFLNICVNAKRDGVEFEE